MIKFDKFSFGPSVLNAMNNFVKRLTVHFDDKKPFWVEWDEREDYGPKDVVQWLRALADEIERRYPNR